MLALPFMLLELVNRREFGEAFPFILFVMLWALPAAVAKVTLSTVNRMHSGVAGSRDLIFRAILVGLFVWFWVGILIDQMPCFLGVPNCD